MYYKPYKIQYTYKFEFNGTQYKNTKKTRQKRLCSHPYGFTLPNLRLLREHLHIVLGTKGILGFPVKLNPTIDLQFIDI